MLLRLTQTLLAFVTQDMSEFFCHLYRRWGRPEFKIALTPELFSVKALMFCFLETVSSVAIYALSNLPFILWQPSSDDVTILRKWILTNQIGSNECKLAQIIIQVNLPYLGCGGTAKVF